MNIAILGKSCYTVNVSSKMLVTTLSGHTMAFTRQLIPFLLYRKHKVALISPCETALEDSTIREDKCDIPEGVDIIPFSECHFPKIPTKCSSLSLLGALSNLQERWGRIDWLLCVYCFPFLLQAEILRQYYKFRIVAFLRGGDGYKFLDYDFLKQKFNVEENIKYVVNFYRYALNHVDFVFTVSEWLRAKVESLGVKVHGIVPSPALVKTELNTHGKRLTKEYFASLLNGRCVYGDLDPHKKWLLSSGRLSMDKKLDLTIKAFSEWGNANWQLVLTGAGPLESDLIRHLTESGKNESCLVFVPPSEMANMFRLSDAYIHTAIPSDLFTDSRPSSVTSAAFYGKPVIFPLSRKGGVRESLSNLNIKLLGFRTLSNHASITKEIVTKLNVLNDEKSIMQVEEANRKFASKFSPERVFNLIEKTIM